MADSENVKIIRRLADALAARNLDGLDELLTSSFYDYVPRQGEQTAPDAFRQVGMGILGAFPDLKVELSSSEEDGDSVRGSFNLSGAFTGNFWGVPGDGREQTWSADFVARFQDGKTALKFENVNLIGIFRGLGIVPAPEEAHLKPKYLPRIPEIILRLAFNGLRLQEKPCSHLDQIKVSEPSTDVCELCVASGDEWPALRMCLTCGFVGCCDTSVNKHVKRHCEETGHPLVRSIMPGESWIWCYEDSAMLSSWHLSH